MKRVMSAAVALALAGAGLAGCSSSDSAGGDSANVKEMTLWMPTLANDNQDQQMWSEILEGFEKDNGVKVNLTVVPWSEYEAKFLTAFSAGQGPDVSYMYPVMIGDYSSKDQLQPLDELLTPEFKERSLYLDRGVVKEKQMGIPFAVGAARIVAYNKDLLAKAGITEQPKTWDDFINTGKQLKDAGITPFIAAYGDKSVGTMNSNFYPFIWQAGGQLFSEDGTKTAFDSPEVLKAANFLKKLQDEGIMSASSTGANAESVRKAFENGEVAYVIESEVRANRWKNAGINYGWFFSLEDKTKGTFSVTDQLVMAKSCKNKELCFKLMDYITKGDQMSKFHKRAPFQPVAKDEKVENPSEFASLYTENSEYLHQAAAVANSSAPLKILYKNVQQMLSGQKSPEQAMKDAAEEGNRALNR